MSVAERELRGQQYLSSELCFVVRSVVAITKSIRFFSVDVATLELYIRERSASDARKQQLLRTSSIKTTDAVLTLVTKSD